MEATIAAFTLVSPAQPATCKAYRPFGGLRFGLSVMVVLQHFQHLLPSFDRPFFDRLGLGAIAVCVFFAVSGFVVTEACATFYVGRPAAFLANRLIRLAPPYFAALVLSVCAHAALWHAGKLALWDYPAAGDPITWARLIAGALGLLPGLHVMLPGDTFEFIPFVWSLRVELAFYACAAAALFAYGHTGDRGRQAVGCLLAVGLSISLAFAVRGQPGLLSCAPMFLVGVALCLAFRQGGWLRVLFLAGTLPVAAAGFATWSQHGHHILDLQLPLAAILLAVLAVLATARAGAWHVLDRKLGDLSYPLYLNHYVVGILLTDLCSWRGLAVYGGGLVLSILLAAIMAALVDTHLAALRDRLRHAVL